MHPILYKCSPGARWWTNILTLTFAPQMRQNSNLFAHGDVTIVLADAYGFCWGVERAVQMAYEARQRFPDSQIHITNEIIHNPGVNEVRFRPVQPVPVICSISPQVDCTKYVCYYSFSNIC